MRSILLASLLFQTLNIFGQTRTIKGKIILELDLTPIHGVRLEYADSSLMAVTDENGEFNVQVPTRPLTISIGGGGFEPTKITLSDSCETVDIILMASFYYDFMTLKKVDRLRLKRFKTLPDLHLAAFEKGIFSTRQACYQQSCKLYSRKGIGSTIFQ